MRAGSVDSRFPRPPSPPQTTRRPVQTTPILAAMSHIEKAQPTLQANGPPVVGDNFGMPWAYTRKLGNPAPL